MAKPIFCATHPRACSTAFERVFMTRKDLTCVHEPFGDAYYFGPERMSARFETDVETRMSSGFSSSTYKTIFDRLEREGEEGKRVFIKDITYYLLPPDGKPSQIAPSLSIKKRGIGTDDASSDEPKETNGVNGVNVSNGLNGDASKAPYPFPTKPEEGNPTIVPKSMLEQFHFTFLIRDPHSSIPSYYRCTIPPLDKVTGWYEFFPNEAGYDELRRFFDYLREIGQVGPYLAENNAANGVNGDRGKAEICVVDADDLLDNPEGIISAYCKSVSMDYHPEMLNWDNEADQTKAKEAFEKWKGFHDDAIDSKDLKPRAHKSAKSEEQWDKEWRTKYGEDAAGVIRQTVNDNMADYHYLKQFALKL